VDSDHHGPALPLAPEPVLTLGHPGPKWTDEAPVQLAGPEEGTERLGHGHGFYQSRKNAGDVQFLRIKSVVYIMYIYIFVCVKNTYIHPYTYTQTHTHIYINKSKHKYK
jgi:hypothetical protein